MLLILISILRHRLRQHLFRLYTILALLFIIFSLPFPKLKRARRHLRHYHLHPQQPQPKKHPHQQQRHSLPLSTFHIYDFTGISEDFFYSILDDLGPQLRQPRTTNGKNRLTKTLLHPHQRLLLVLHYLRYYPHTSNLALLFATSASTVTREINFILPKLYISLRKLAPIFTPANLQPHRFEQAMGVIDCTSHFRLRVHPRQADWYRRDKHGFFITAQVCTHSTLSASPSVPLSLFLRLYVLS